MHVGEHKQCMAAAHFRQALHQYHACSQSSCSGYDVVLLATSGDYQYMKFDWPTDYIFLSTQ
jgi:hypothetical protein